MKTISLFFCACMLSTVFTGCAEEKNFLYEEDDLQGIWYEEQYYEDEHRISRLQYHFMENNVLEVLRIEIDANLHSILGYRFRTTGNYKLEGDQLTFYNLSSYMNNDTETDYAALENLQPVDENETSYTVTIELSEIIRRLILIYPPCGPAENCIGSTTLKKD
jgi:hypothetical protein